MVGLDLDNDCVRGEVRHEFPQVFADLLFDVSDDIGRVDAAGKSDDPTSGSVPAQPRLVPGVCENEMLLCKTSGAAEPVSHLLSWGSGYRFSLTPGAL